MNKLPVITMMVFLLAARPPPPSGPPNGDGGLGQDHSRRSPTRDPDSRYRVQFTLAPSLQYNDHTGDQPRGPSDVWRAGRAEGRPHHRPRAKKHQQTLDAPSGMAKYPAVGKPVGRLHGTRGCRHARLLQGEWAAYRSLLLQSERQKVETSA